MTEQDARLLYWDIQTADERGDSDWEPTGYNPLAGGGYAVVVRDRFPDAAGACRTHVLEDAGVWRLHRIGLAATWNARLPAGLPRVEVG